MCVTTDPGLISAVFEVRDELRAAGVRVFVFGRRQQGFNCLSDVADDQNSHNLGDYKEGMIYNVFYSMNNKCVGRNNVSDLVQNRHISGVKY